VNEPLGRQTQRDVRMKKKTMSDRKQAKSMVPDGVNPLDNSGILVRPAKLLSMANPVGDCTAHTMVVCALLKALGISCEMVTVATDPAKPDEFNHVYAEAILKNGVRMALDTSGPYPGWEPPHIYRRKRWGILRPEDS
jgi:hypothetical protein